MTLRNLRQVRKFLGLTQTELAAQIPHTQKRKGQGLDDSYISHMENGDTPITDTVLKRIPVLIANKLTARYGREIGVRFSVNSPWRITPMFWCYKCRRWHELKQARQICKR